MSRHTAIQSFVALFGCACALAAHAGASKSCADPYWADTLRCLVYQPVLPQPVPPPPATVADLRAFTRVDLIDPTVRCVDGTRPIIYVDAAVGTPTNRWVITMTGGEHCAARDSNGDGSFDDGQGCYDAYIEQNGALMGTALQPAMSSLTDAEGNVGIQSADLARNPVFARYNRVRIHKCSFDRYSGRATHLGVSAQPSAGPAIQYDQYNHGQKIVLLALDTLRGQGAGQSGLVFNTWINQGGVVTPVQRTLPSIADAEQVVLVGHSAAAHGLFQNADRHAGYLRAMPGFTGDVRAIHDAHFMHAAENEAAFDPAQNPTPLILNTLFDRRTTGVSPEFGAYNAANYYGGPNSSFVIDYHAWLETPLSTLGTLVDESCYNAHVGSNDTWRCNDQFHVRLHHETTSSLMREDYRDPNRQHLNLPFGFVTFWGPFAAYAHCAGLGFAGLCPPVLNGVPLFQRLNVQARHFIEGIHTRSELATGADPSGTPGTAFLWMPNCATHAGIYDDLQFFESSIARGSDILRYREFVQRFVAAPATGVIQSYVVGLDGAVSECGPRMVASGFE
jgi:hypothetical protein